MDAQTLKDTMELFYPDKEEALRYCQEHCLFEDQELDALFCKTCNKVTPHRIFVMNGNFGRRYPHFWCAVCFPKPERE